MMRGPRAFSMIEVALAAAILLGGLAGLASALPQMSRIQEHQRKLAEAGTVAGNVTEIALRAQDKNTLTAGAVRGTFDARGLASPSGTYTATRTVTFNTPVANAREILVVVDWQESGTTKSYSLTTYAYTVP
jgi:type II secretory pathway pseudopilin PulG